MRVFFLSSLMLVSPVMAQDNAQSLELLLQCLEKQRDCLMAVQDANQAQLQLKPYKTIAKTLAEMRSQITDEEAFYTYVQTQEESMGRLIDLLHEQMVQITRLHQAKFYGVKEWYKLLSLPEIIQ